MAIRIGCRLAELCVDGADTYPAVRNSAVVALVDRQPWPAAEMEMAPPILWFAAIQCIKRKQDLADLAPKGRFISAESVKRIAGQIGET